MMTGRGSRNRLRGYMALSYNLGTTLKKLAAAM